MRAAAMPVIGLIGHLLLCCQGAVAAPLGVALPAEARPDEGRLALVWPQAVDAAMASEAGTARLRMDQPLAPIPSDRLQALAPWLSKVVATADGREILLRLRPGVIARLTRPHPRLAVIGFVRAEPATTAMPTPLLPALVEPAAGPPPLPPIPASRPAFAAAEPPTPTKAPDLAQIPPPSVAGAQPELIRVTVSAQPNPHRLELRFRWGAAAPAAIFQRGDRLWAVFPDGRAEVAGWRSLDRPEVAAWLRPLGTASAGGARLFRFRLARPATIAARSDDAGWTVSLGPPDAGDPEAPGHAAVLRRPEAGALEAEAVGTVAQVRDPESGERLGLFMSEQAGLRQTAPERLVDLELLPSVQGLVWRPLADGVRASASDGRLTITRPGGLRLSQAEITPTQPPPAADRETTRALQAPAAPALAASSHAVPTASVQVERDGSLPAALGLTAMTGSGPAARETLRRRITDQLRGLAGLPRAEARLELARLYLADALGPEARTALELIDPADIAAAAAGPQRLSHIALSGAAEALAGQPDPALVKLLDHALDADREVALWRAYAAALAERRDLAQQEWVRSGGLPDSYPDPLRRRLGLELASSLLAGADPAAATALLERLRGLALEPSDAARLELLQGMAHAKAGATAQARDALATAAAKGDADIAARAAFLLVDTRLGDGSMTEVEGLAELVGQRARWRGHPWESRMLARLAALQAGHGQPVAAVGSWREAIARSAEPELATGYGRALRDHLAATLDDRRLSAALRLALHQAHGRELDGDPRADAIRARLAVAAADLGLADRAIELATAAGAEAKAIRPELARSLAAAGSLDAALQQARQDAGLAGLRDELAARAQLAQAGTAQADAAMAEGDPAAMRPLARAAVVQRGDWAEVAAIAGADLAAAGADGPLDPRRAEAAIWLGLAQAHRGGEADAAAVAARYLERIESGPEHNLLMLVTLAPPPDGPPEQLATAAARYATAIRAGLAALPPLATAAPVRTASAHSAPGG